MPKAVPIPRDDHTAAERREAATRGNDADATRSHGEVDRDRRSGRVRLLTHPLWRRPCKLELTNPKHRPLSAPILARFSSYWNSVDQPFLSRRCRRAAGALYPTPGEGAGTNGADLSDHRHPGSCKPRARRHGRRKPPETDDPRPAKGLPPRPCSLSEPRAAAPFRFSLASPNPLTNSTLLSLGAARIPCRRRNPKIGVEAAGPAAIRAAARGDRKQIARAVGHNVRRGPLPDKNRLLALNLAIVRAMFFNILNRKDSKLSLKRKRLEAS